MQRRTTLLLAATCWMSAPLPALAGNSTIFQGDVTFTRNAFGTAPGADLKGVSSVPADDFLTTLGWWYRKAGETEETAFPSATGQLYSDNVSTISWDGLAGGAFDALEHTEVYDDGIAGVPGDGGRVHQFLTVDNLSGSQTLNVSIFHFADIDVVANTADDFAAWVEYPHLIEITDSPNFAQYAGAAAAHRVAAHPVVLNALNDEFATNFANSGTPAGPFDYTGGLQWNLSIPPNGSVQLVVILAVNASAHCASPAGTGIFCDRFESNNLNFWGDTNP